MRVSAGAGRPTRNGGFLHRLTDHPRKVPHGRRTIVVPLGGARRADLPGLARGYADALTPGLLEQLAARLGLSERSLRRLRAGWAFDGGRGCGILDAGDAFRVSAAGAVWSFPMLDPAGRVLGVRLRHPDGRKSAVPGSREGLFLPDGLLLRDGPRGRLLVAEGPTDCAALLDLGFDAVGRPSCTGGVRHLTALCSARRPAEVVAVADVDPHGAGQRGAESLATVLLAYCPAVRVFRPPAPFKDAREWVLAGATSDAVLSVIEAAAVRHLTVSVRGAAAVGRRVCHAT
jgi:hypothetical protein